MGFADEVSKQMVNQNERRAASVEEEAARQADTHRVLAALAEVGREIATVMADHRVPPLARMALTKVGTPRVSDREVRKLVRRGRGASTPMAVSFRVVPVDGPTVWQLTGKTIDSLRDDWPISPTGVTAAGVVGNLQLPSRLRLHTPSILDGLTQDERAEEEAAAAAIASYCAQHGFGGDYLNFQPWSQLQVTGFANLLALSDGVASIRTYPGSRYTPFVEFFAAAVAETITASEQRP